MRPVPLPVPGLLCSGRICQLGRRRLVCVVTRLAARKAGARQALHLRQGWVSACP